MVSVFVYEEHRVATGWQRIPVDRRFLHGFCKRIMSHELHNFVLHCSGTLRFFEVRI